MKIYIMTKNSIIYTIDKLFKIANPNGNLAYLVNIDYVKRQVNVSFKNSEKKILFNLAEDEAWYKIINNIPSKLHYIDNFNGKYKIPILFWNDNRLLFITRKDSCIEFNGDIISSSFFMLSRWEETQIDRRDIHGRFRFIDSVAFKYDFIDIPIVDEYGMILRQELQTLFPNIDIGVNKFYIKMSHDIDDIRRFPNIKKSIRTFGGDLLKTKSLSLFANSFREYTVSRIKPDKDPYFVAIYELAELSKLYKKNSVFYFKTADKSDHDSGYAIDYNVKDCINYLQEEGFEVGFHPGYYTYQNYDKLMAEKLRLDNILGKTNYGGRHHYLRFDVNTTWKHWEKAGLEYDSSVGYAEHEGFRCGTCHPFKPFYLKEDKELNIYEIPLIVMDGTLQGYRKLTPMQGLDSILALIDRCKDVEGVFTLLWHNTAMCRGWGIWVENVYKKVLVYE